MKTIVLLFIIIHYISTQGGYKLIQSQIQYTTQQYDIRLDDKQIIHGIEKKTAIIIDKGQSQMKIDTIITDELSKATSQCDFVEKLINNAHIGVICDMKTVLIFDVLGIPIFTFIIPKNEIYFLNEIRPDIGLMITKLKYVSQYQIQLLSLNPLVTVSNNVYSITDSRNYVIYCQIVSTLNFVLCIYTTVADEFIVSVLLTEEMVFITNKNLIAVYTLDYDFLCEEIQCFIFFTTQKSNGDNNEVIKQILTFENNKINIKNEKRILFNKKSWVKCVSLSSTILLEMYESSTIIYFQLIYRNLENHGPAIPYMKISGSYSSYRGVFLYHEMTYVLFLYSDKGPKQQSILFLTYPPCQDKVFAILFDKIQKVNILPTSHDIVFTKNPNQSVEGRQIQIEQVYSMPFEFQYVMTGTFIYTFSSIKSIETPISQSNNQVSNLYSLPCQLTVNVCSLNQVIDLTLTKCITSTKLEEDMDDIMDNIGDIILDLPQNGTVGNSSYEIIETNNGTDNSHNSGNLSRIDLGKCEEVLRIHYGISLNEPLLIFKKDTIEEGRLSNQVEYAVFMMNGFKLDLSICDDEEITISIPVNNPNDDKYNTMKNLSEKNKVNLYDPNDPFFSDICVPFTSENGTDVTRHDRVNDFLHNASSICPQKCTVKEIDYKTNMTKCSCKENTTSAKPGVDPFGEIKDSLINSVTNSNWKVIYCYKLVFNITIFISNIGSWFMIGIGLLLFIIMCIFFVTQFTTTEQYLNTLDREQITTIQKERKKLRMNSYSHQKEIDSPVLESRGRIDLNHSFRSQSIKTQKSHFANNNEVPIIPKVMSNQLFNKINIKNKISRFGQNNEMHPIINQTNTKKEPANIICIIDIDNVDDNKKKNNSMRHQTNDNNSMRHQTNDNNSMRHQTNDNNSMRHQTNDNYSMRHQINNNNSMIHQKHYTNQESNANLMKFKKSNSLNHSCKSNTQSQDNNSISIHVNHSINPHVTETISHHESLNTLQTETNKKTKSYHEMTFEECLSNDHRSFMLHYWDYLKLVHPILSTFFCPIGPRVIRTLLISQFLISIMIDFVMSAFFYSDNYISNNYHSEGLSNFFYNLPISVYSFLISFVLGIFFNIISNIGSKLDDIEKNKSKSNSLLKDMKKILCCFKIKVTFFFICEILLMVFSWYYTAAFCAVYFNSQNEWLQSGLISTAIGQAFPFVTALLFAIILRVCYCCKSKCCFKILSWIT